MQQNNSNNNNMWIYFTRQEEKLKSEGTTQFYIWAMAPEKAP